MSCSPRLAALAALLVALAAAGCGVPGRTDVVVDGKGQEADVPGSSGAEALPLGPDGVGNNVPEFVKRFLEAPAGDWDGAAARVKRFLSPEQQASWQAPREITVIRLRDGKPDIKPTSPYEVVLDVLPIGLLTSRGTLEPPRVQSFTTYRFTVGQVDGNLAVLTPPPGVMLLTDAALHQWYEQRPIYFWDTGRTSLVPDLRYLPRAVEKGARPKLLIDWLIGGPADWLQAGVLGLPDGSKQLRNAYTDKGRLIVNLSDAATGQGRDLDQLLAQLCWTLRDDFTGNVELQIEFQKRAEGSSSDYLDRNPVYRLADRGPELFAVAGGAVRRVQFGAVKVPDEVPHIEPAVNKNVRYAALANGYAALVRTEGDALRLWVGPEFVATSLVVKTMSRPVLVDGQNAGYVAADGKLYRFTRGNSKVTEVAVAGLSGGVTSIALAPDGRRLAVVAGGRPYVVGLGGDGDAPAGAARPVPAPLSDLTAITWLSETNLAMAGRRSGKVALARVSMDGAVINNQQDLNTSPVIQLVSFLENPVNGIGGSIMLEADNQAYEVYSSLVDPIPPQRLAGPPVKTAPVAPFFLE